MKSRQYLKIAGLILWLSGIAYGCFYLTNYSLTPNIIKDSPATWPSKSQLTPVPNKHTLIMFMHPFCSCSQASLHELLKVLTQVNASKRQTYLVFFKPGNDIEQWKSSSLWKEGCSIKGVECLVDINGEESKRFNAGISGYTVLYSPNGNLEFNGGITASRAHEGDSNGYEQLLLHLRQDNAKKQTTPVFGCSIFNNRKES